MLVSWILFRIDDRNKSYGKEILFSTFNEIDFLNLLEDFSDLLDIYNCLLSEKDFKF